jgi:CheY-like chemotaxis protein
MKTLLSNEQFHGETTSIPSELEPSVSSVLHPKLGPDKLSKLESLGLFIGTIAHSIKGLCTGLDGGIYLFNSGEANEDEERQQRGLAMIQRNTNRLRRLVNNTLYYGKARSLELLEVKIEEVYAEVIETLGNKARRLGISLTTFLEDPQDTVVADMSALTAAIINLVENALDACAADSAEKDHKVDLCARSEKGLVCFLIRDNGIGMDLNTKNNAVDLFFSSKGSSGTGLGLFIAEQIASSHGGSLEIQSSVGEGTSITMVFPKSGLYVNKKEDEISIEEKKSVLVIEDELDVRDYLTCLFSDNGFKVKTASNGEEGLTCLEKNLPDLVTLDITMPLKTGLLVYRAMRKNAAWKDIPIIIVTGVAKEFKCFFSSRRTLPPPDGYINKPIDCEKLLDLAKRLTFPSSFST